MGINGIRGLFLIENCNQILCPLIPSLHETVKLNKHLNL